MKPRTLAVAAALVSTLSGVAHAQSQKDCKLNSLRGEYVFSATGFTRAAPGMPWVPKAIIEVLSFGGDGTLTTPAVTVANPVNDTGAIISPPNGGSPGAYTLSENCVGTITFADGVAFKIYVAPLGNELWLLQTQGLGGSQNVFQGKAERVWM